jgi:hypothetical protein
MYSDYFSPMNPQIKKLALLFFFIALGGCGSANQSKSNSSEFTQNPAPVFFELRTYYCHPDKLDDLMARFKNHTLNLFEKHGMVNVAYWLPMDNQDNKLVYLMGYQSHEQRDKAWETFMNDPEWKEVEETSQMNGPLVASIVNQLMTYTDYSPQIEIADMGKRIFSHRTYYTHEGKLEDLHTRFKEHTLEIFKNNGITNVVYFNLEESDPQSKNVLHYFISFPDTATRTASWKSFGQDPEWTETYANSIKNGKLVDSLTAELLLPVDFSPIK